MTDWQLALDAVLRSWLGTPYAHGQGRRGVAADCIGFVAAALDELHGLSLPPPERHAPDVAWHDPRAACRVTSRVSRRWPHEVVRGRAFPEPGDVLICRVGRSPTGHVMIAGADPRLVWHCDGGTGVCFTGYRAVAGLIIRIWRPMEKSSWSTPLLSPRRPSSTSR